MMTRVIGLPREFYRMLRSRRRRRRRLLSRKYDQWSIGILEGPTLSSLTPPAGVANPVLTAADVTDCLAAFVADPFMIRVDGSWCMFFEVLNRARGLGEIALATSPDAVHWTYRRVVLSEPFHLSYPLVFQWRGDFYMVPETHQAGSVRLYRARRFPHQWELVDTLLEGESLSDSTVFRHEGRWWMLVETGGHEHGWARLSLYFANGLRGPWREHPRSPVVNGVANAARPAGRVVRHGNGLLRLAQVCTPQYGTAVRGYPIAELTTDGYREMADGVIELLGPGSTGWNRTGMHHMDAHQLEDGRWIACVDACADRELPVSPEAASLEPRGAVA